MTWNWTLTKFGIGFGLGIVSSNPVGWAIGIPTATLIKFKNKENLNSSTLTLVDKVGAQRWIELAEDHQIGAGLGIAFKGFSSVASEILSNTTSKIGQDAGREIAKNGFQTELARTLINRGKDFAKLKHLIIKASNLHEIEEIIKGFSKLIRETSLKSNEEEFTQHLKTWIESQNLLLDRIEMDLNEKKTLLNSVRDNILDINKKNIKFFINYEENEEEHRLINHEINQALNRIKTIQLNLHNDHNCCDKCRFC